MVFTWIHSVMVVCAINSLACSAYMLASECASIFVCEAIPKQACLLWCVCVAAITVCSFSNRTLMCVLAGICGYFSSFGVVVAKCLSCSELAFALACQDNQKIACRMRCLLF